jgi:arsenite methyltransferase
MSGPAAGARANSGEIFSLSGWVSCLAGAGPIARTQRILAEAGLTVTAIERHDSALIETIEQVESRIRAIKLADLPFLPQADLDRAIAVARSAVHAVARGDAGYVLFSAQR